MMATIRMALAALLVMLLLMPMQRHAYAAEALVIGQSLPLGVADDGNSARIVAGAQAYVARINTAGGILGRPLRLVTLDDGGDPLRHAANLRRLVEEDKAVAFINCRGDASCAAAAEVARELRVPLVGPMSGAAAASRSANPFVFRIRASYAREADALARQLLALGVLHLAIATDSRPLSQTVLALTDALARHQLRSTVITVDMSGDAGHAAVVKQLEAGRFAAVFVDLGTQSLAQLAQQKLAGKSAPWPLLVMSFASGNVNSLFTVFPQRMLGFTAVVPNPELSAMPLARELQAQAERAGGGSALTYAGMESYINTKVCVEGLRRAEAAKGDARQLASALNGLGTLDLGGFYLNFSSGSASASDWVDIVVRSRTGTLLSRAPAGRMPDDDHVAVPADAIGALGDDWPDQRLRRAASSSAATPATACVACW